MKVVEHYDKASEPLISFEIIPPKRGGAVSDVFESLDKVVDKVKPPFIDVTYHAAEANVEEQKDGTLKRVIRRKRPGTIGFVRQSCTATASTRFRILFVRVFQKRKAKMP